MPNVIRGLLCETRRKNFPLVNQSKFGLVNVGKNSLVYVREKFPSRITIQIWSVILLWEKFPLVKYDREKFPNDILS